ncbi:basal body-orientation factor 1 [Arapaima gigas]
MKKKGKGKTKKGAKQEFTPDKESDMEKTEANAALWEARLNVTEVSRAEYRKATRRLAQVNEELTNHQYHAEKDMADIITFLKLKETEKEQKIAQLEEQLREQEAEAREESQRLVSEYTRKITELEDKFQERSQDFQVIQGELKMIKEFRKKKAQMEQELRELKEKIYIEDKDHKENLAQMERKFLREKLRLEKEAEQQIARLAERAHKDAVVQLDEASRTVFAENVRLNEALRYHVKEAEELRKTAAALVEENSSLALHKETSKMMVVENVSRLKRQVQEIADLRGKVSSLERTLGLTAAKFQQERQEAERQLKVDVEAAHMEVDRLQKVLATQEQEVGRVKWLARHLVEQRTELERFFHEALEQVRREVRVSQEQCHQAAMGVCWQGMKTARLGHRQNPHLRTLNGRKHSANSICANLEKADKWSCLQSAKVDISELTWEQKENVLRLLFAKMNGLKVRKFNQSLALPEFAEKDKNVSNPRASEELTKVTFITQTPVSTLSSIHPSHLSRLPPINIS